MTSFRTNGLMSAILQLCSLGVFVVTAGGDQPGEAAQCSTCSSLADNGTLGTALVQKRLQRSSVVGVPYSRKLCPGPCPPPPSTYATTVQKVRMQNAALDPIPQISAQGWPWTVGPAKRSDNRPNVIVIVGDDLGYNDVSIMNEDRRAADPKMVAATVETPNIDALARDGAMFDRAYSAAHTCSPSRSSILTGRFSQRYGHEFTPVPSSFAQIGKLYEWHPYPGAIDETIAAGNPPYQTQGTPSSEITVAEIFREAGYYTAAVGKWHIGGNNGMDQISQGFVEALEHHNMSGYASRSDPDTILEEHYDVESFIDGQMYMTSMDSAIKWINKSQGDPAKSHPGHRTDYETDQALQIIENNANNPFFLYFSPWSVHNPYQALKSDYDLFDYELDHKKRVYMAMVHCLDRNVGRIRAKVRELGLENKTIIVFMSDNGGANYAKLPNINQPFTGWKTNPFEGGMRVPLIITYPGTIPPNIKRYQMVHSVDIFHTVSDLAGISTPSDIVYDGVSLRSCILKDAKAHESLYWQQSWQVVVMTQKYKLIQSKQYDNNMKDIMWLFDLENDPREFNDLSLTLPNVVTEMQALAANYSAQMLPPLWSAFMYYPGYVDTEEFGPKNRNDRVIYTLA